MSKYQEALSVLDNAWHGYPHAREVVFELLEDAHNETRRPELTKTFLDIYVNHYSRCGTFWPCTEHGLKQMAKDADITTLEVWIKPEFYNGNTSERLCMLAQSGRNKLFDSINQTKGKTQ
jgi:hypothetical protein